ncbi:hypothetical protein SDJN03_02209, partial [Cucurbita argyrosperma subsp. sororia]
MASIGARSVFRSLSGSARRAAAHIGSQARSSSGSPFRMATNKPLSHRTFRCAAEMSFSAVGFPKVASTLYRPIDVLLAFLLLWAVIFNQLV